MAQNTISDELNRLIQAKADIKSALEEKGLTIGDSSTLDEYPALIQEMEVGGGGSDTSTLIDLIEGDISGDFVIPNGTTQIGENGLSALGNVNVIFPDTVNLLKTHATYKSKIKRLDLYDTSITKIYQSGLEYSTELEYLSLPKNLTTVSALIARGCTKLKKVIIPASVTQLAQGNCFQGCSGMEEILILSKNNLTTDSEGMGRISNNIIYFPNEKWDLYKSEYINNKYNQWYKYDCRPIASMSYDSQTYTVTALGRDNLELYIDASLCDSSVYTFSVDNRNHTIEVKSVDPSYGLLDSSTMTVYIGEPQYMALTCSDPNGATVSMTQTLGNNSGVNVVDMKYSTDGTNWNNWTHTDVTENDSTTYTFNTISLNEGDKVYFKGDNSTGLGYTTSNTGNARFVLNGNLGASGNVMSLLYDDDFQEYNSVPNNGLSSLFTGCASLTTAPELPATTLGNWCYSRMFQGCTSLNYVKAMFTAQDAATHTQYWLNNVSATGTFVKNPEALWSESDIIPSGWTVETAES